MILGKKRLLLALPLAIQFLYVLQGVFSFPYATGDAYAIWFLKAKVLAKVGWQGFMIFLNSWGFNYANPSYPIALPLFFVAIFRFLGEVNDLALMLLYPFVYLVTAIALYRILRVGVDRWWAWVAVFLWSTFPVVERLAGRGEVGFADLPLSLFMLLGTYYALKFSRTGFPMVFVFAVFWLGLAANTKFEGALWVLSLLLSSLISLGLKKAKRILWVSVVSLILVLPWLFFIYSQNLPLVYFNSGNNLLNLSRLARLPGMFVYSAGEFLRFERWGVGLLGLGVTTVLLSRRILRSPFRPVFLAILMQMGGYLFIYLISPAPVASHMSVTWYRVLAQLLPLLFWLDFTVFKAKKNV